MAVSAFAEFKPRLVLTLLSLSLYTPALHAAIPLPFIPYPATDDCGPSAPLGVIYKTTCPMDVCAADRAACDDAMQARKQCLLNKCSNESMAQVYADAKAACGASVQCVQSVCYSSFPTEAYGYSCKVRSYYKGECCCNKGKPLFRTVKGENRAVAVDPKRGLRTGECVILDGQTDLSGIVKGSNGAKVFSVCITSRSSWGNTVDIEYHGTNGFPLMQFSITDLSGDLTVPINLWSSGVGTIILPSPGVGQFSWWVRG